MSTDGDLTQIAQETDSHPPESGSEDSTSVFVQRGFDAPYRKNLGATFTTPLSAETKAEIQHIIEDAEVSTPQLKRLHTLLDEDAVRVWGAGSEHDVVRDMAPGDWVIYVDPGQTRSKSNIQYRNRIDLALPQPEAPSTTEVHGEIANLLWRSDSFTSFWFSTSEVISYENPTEMRGINAFNELIQECDPQFAYYRKDADGTYWYTDDNTSDSLLEIQAEYLSYYGGAEAFLRRIEGTKYVNQSELPDPAYLVVDHGHLCERNAAPVVHEFDGYQADPAAIDPDPRLKFIHVATSETPDSLLDAAPDQAAVLMEADVSGYVLVRDGNQIVASAKLGCVFGKTVDEQFEVDRSGFRTKFGALVDYREFPAPVSVEHARLALTKGTEVDPSTAVVASLSADKNEARRAFQTARALAVSPGYFERLEQFVDEESLQQEIYQVAIAHLISGKNPVFYGPPGTGKTRVAKRLSKLGFGVGYDLSTAHAELTNYDIVGGYAPGKLRLVPMRPTRSRQSTGNPIPGSSAKRPRSVVISFRTQIYTTGLFSMKSTERIWTRHSVTSSPCWTWTTAQINRSNMPMRRSGSPSPTASSAP